jgi:hypothetical protein
MFFFHDCRRRLNDGSAKAESARIRYQYHEITTIFTSVLNAFIYMVFMGQQINLSFGSTA